MRNLWVALGMCMSLVSCSSARPSPAPSALQHLLDVYIARFPHWDDSATDGYPKTEALEDLGTVALPGGALRVVYFSFCWSLAENSVHGTQKILIFRVPNQFIGEVYLGQPLVTSSTRLLPRVVTICLEDGQRSEIIFPENGSPEIRGDIGLIYSDATCVD